MTQSTTADNDTAHACHLSALVSIKVSDIQWNYKTGGHAMLLRQLRELQSWVAIFVSRAAQKCCLLVSLMCSVLPLKQ